MDDPIMTCDMFNDIIDNTKKEEKMENTSKFGEVCGNLWSNALDLYYSSENKLGAVYTLGTIAKIYIKSYVKVDELRDMLNIALTEKDHSQVKKILYRLENYLNDEKAMCSMYSLVKQDYERIVNEYIDSITNTALVVSIPTFDDLETNVREYIGVKQTNVNEKLEQQADLANKYLDSILGK